MNINSFAVAYIPLKKDIITFSCRYCLNGECQLLNKECSGKSNKYQCKYFNRKY